MLPCHSRHPARGRPLPQPTNASAKQVSGWGALIRAFWPCQSRAGFVTASTSCTLPSSPVLFAAGHRATPITCVLPKPVRLAARSVMSSPCRSVAVTIANCTAAATKRCGGARLGSTRRSPRARCGAKPIHCRRLKITLVLTRSPPLPPSAPLGSALLSQLPAAITPPTARVTKRSQLLRLDLNEPAQTDPGQPGQCEKEHWSEHGGRQTALRRNAIRHGITASVGVQMNTAFSRRRMIKHSHAAFGGVPSRSSAGSKGDRLRSERLAGSLGSNALIPRSKL
jgi:hypothetical protein